MRGSPSARHAPPGVEMMQQSTLNPAMRPDMRSLSPPAGSPASDRRVAFDGEKRDPSTLEALRTSLRMLQHPEERTEDGGVLDAEGRVVSDSLSNPQHASGGPKTYSHRLGAGLMTFVALAKSPEKREERRCMRLRKMLEGCHFVISLLVIMMAVLVMHLTFDSECRCLLRNAYEYNSDLRSAFPKGAEKSHTKYRNLYYYASYITSRVPSTETATGHPRIPKMWSPAQPGVPDVWRNQMGEPISPKGTSNASAAVREAWAHVDPMFLSISNYCNCASSEEIWEITVLKIAMGILSLLAVACIFCRAIVQTRLHTLRGLLPRGMFCMYDGQQWATCVFEMLLNLFVVPPWFHQKYEAEVWTWGGVSDAYVPKRIFHEHANSWNIFVFLRLYTVFRVVRNISGFANVHAELVSSAYGINSSSIRFATKMVLRQFPIQAMVPVFCTVLISTAALVWMCEAGAPGGINRLDQCVWCTITTMSTVGYGDLYPITMKGRTLITVFGMVGGLIFSTLTVASVIEWVRALSLPLSLLSLSLSLPLSLSLSLSLSSLFWLHFNEKRRTVAQHLSREARLIAVGGGPRGEHFLHFVLKFPPGFV